MDFSLFVINVITLLIPILFGAFSAKRLNFIHGFIVTICWYAIISGIYFVALRFMDMSVLANIASGIQKYCAYIVSVSVSIYGNCVYYLSNVAPKVCEYLDFLWLGFGIAIMIVSSILAHIIRSFRQKI